ncbi:unnamed protein product, partial [marine sediment metagenome]
MIDLRQYYQQSTTKQKYNSVLINKFTELIKQTEQQTVGNNKNSFRLKAFRNALNSIKNFPEKIVSGQQISHLKGIGPGTIKRIDGILKSGDLEELSESKHSTVEQDPSIAVIKTLCTVTGIGPKRAQQLYDDGYLSVQNIQDDIADNCLEVT